MKIIKPSSNSGKTEVSFRKTGEDEAGKQLQDAHESIQCERQLQDNSRKPETDSLGSLPSSYREVLLQIRAGLDPDRAHYRSSDRYFSLLSKYFID